MGARTQMTSHEPDIRRKGLGFVRFKLHNTPYILDMEPFILVSFGTFCCCALRFCARFRQLRMLANMKFIGNLFLRQLLSIKVIGQATSSHTDVARRWNLELSIKTVHCTKSVYPLYNIRIYIYLVYYIDMIYMIIYQILPNKPPDANLECLEGGQGPDRHQGWKCTSERSHDRMCL